jgi:hypothetical protein
LLDSEHSVMRLQLTNEFRMSSSLDRQGAQVRDTG